MMAGAIAQLAVEAAAKHVNDGTPRDRDSLTGRAEKIWAEHATTIVEALAEDFELEATKFLADSLAGEFINSYVAARVDTGPRGKHTPLQLAWVPAIAEAPSAFVPPAAKQLSNYVVSWDPSRRAFVYAASLDYHQFGQAWTFDGTSWSQLNTHAFRAGSLEQATMGAYDAERGGLIGWNLDNDRPFGVLVRDGGISVLRHRDPNRHDYGKDPFQEIDTLDTPEVERGDWSDLVAVFAHDPVRKVWVMLTATDVWELDRENRWSKRAAVASGVLPEDISGERDHGGEGAGALWDAARQVVVFWFVSDESFRFFTWDGKQLAALEGAGLPPNLMVRNFGVKRGSVVAAHPKLGLVVYAGPDLGMFALDGATWVSHPMGSGAPPASFSTSLAFAPSGDALLGPGKFVAAPKPSKGDDADEDDDDEDDDDDEVEGAQAVFHVRRNDTWARMGNVKPVSPLKKIRGQSSWPMFGAAGGSVYATSPMKSLEAVRFDATGWTTVVDAQSGQTAFAAGAEKSAPRQGLVEGPGGNLFAIASNGAVFELGPKGWQTRSPASEVFGWRRGFQAAYDVAGERLIVWGGDSTGRSDVDDTLAWQHGAWTLLPRGGRSVEYRKDGGVDLELAYDSALGRVIRVGAAEASVLDGSRWRTMPVKPLREFVSGEHRVICHDPRTRETLVVSTLTGKVARFDLAEPDLVGTIAEIKVGENDEAVYVRRQIAVFEPRSRKLYACDDDKPRVLDLGPAFDLAATLGPRQTTLPEAGPDPIRLYKSTGQRIDVFYVDATADNRLRLREGPLGGELTSTVPWDKSQAEIDKVAAERRRAGYVTAAELDEAALRAALSRPVWYLDVADEPVKKGLLKAEPVSRIGGCPSGLDADAWPKSDDDEPMGFLYQVALPKELGGGGIAVFVKTDGTATEDDDNNVAIRLTDAQLAGKPTKPPKGVREAKVRPITIGERDLELGRSLVETIARDDGDLGARLESMLPSDPGFAKIGGYATFIQEGPADAELLVQLDFDGISFEEKGWDEVGLMGGLYVIAYDGKPHASWQYT